MNLRFTTPFEREPGVIVSLLKESYAELVESEPDNWRVEIKNWEETDRSVFENPKTVGACTFLSCADADVIGFFGFDPRPRPSYGVIGHNCILPAFRRQGFGTQQINEILRRLRDIGIKSAKVSTNDHPFFIPAQRMYAACGFREVKRVPWERDPKRSMIHYEIIFG